MTRSFVLMIVGIVDRPVAKGTAATEDMSRGRGGAAVESKHHDDEEFPPAFGGGHLEQNDYSKESLRQLEASDTCAVLNACPVGYDRGGRSHQHMTRLSAHAAAEHALM